LTGTDDIILFNYVLNDHNRVVKPFTTLYGFPVNLSRK